MKIFIVFGCRGEYSSREEWPVVAYTEKTRAQKHAENATKRAAEITEQIKVINDPWAGDEMEKACESNEYDPAMQFDPYTGTTYFLHTVELVQ